MLTNPAIAQLKIWNSAQVWLQESEAGIQAELDNLMTLYPALKGTPFAQWQGNKGLVCLHMGSMAPSDLLPDCAVLSKLLTSALQKANMKGVLLTGSF